MADIPIDGLAHLVTLVQGKPLNLWKCAVVSPIPQNSLIYTYMFVFVVVVFFVAIFVVVVFVVEGEIWTV